MNAPRHWSLTLDPAVLKGLIGDAWLAMPDDMTGDHDRLADAITALVAQRDAAQAECNQPQVTSLARGLVSILRDSGAQIADHPFQQDIVNAVAALVEQRDEARAERDRPRVDDRNATAIAKVAHREGYSDALDDIRDAMADIPDGFDAEWRLAFLSGWLTARRAA